MQYLNLCIGSERRRFQVMGRPNSSAIGRNWSPENCCETLCYLHENGKKIGCSRFASLVDEGGGRKIGIAFRFWQGYLGGGKERELEVSGEGKPAVSGEGRR